MSLPDLVTLLTYLALCIGLGVYLGGKPVSSLEYFTSKGGLPWWAVSFSIVATETSVLTILSTPTVAYLGSMAFLQLVIGYILGRTLVAFFILPSYFKEQSLTAYTLIGTRFGAGFKKLISATFLVTRLLADGVRLFAAAIPLKVLTGLGYTESILLIAVITLIYTWYGGIKSVIWVDFMQFIVYIIGGLISVFLLYTLLGDSPFPSEKLQIFQFSGSLEEVLTKPYHGITAMIGGLFLSMASHGTDHLIVQRLLTCQDLQKARKALIWSGLFVFIQFALFLGIGALLYGVLNGISIQELGLQKPDELFPYFILNYLPAGMAGLMIAGLFAAAMSTLSSSLAALSSSTLFDLFPQWAEHPKNLSISRGFMLIWTFIFIVFALQFSGTNHPIIEIGLGIAGFTYGGLLGAFLVALFTKLNTSHAVTGFIACILGMIYLIKFTALAWPWYTVSGVLIFGLFAVLSSVLLRLRPTTIKS